MRDVGFVVKRPSFSAVSVVWDAPRHVTVVKTQALRPASIQSAPLDG